VNGNCFSDAYVIPKLSCSRFFDSRPSYLLRDTTLNKQFNDSPFPDPSKLYGGTICQGMPQGRDRSLGHVLINFTSWHVVFYRTTADPGVTTDRIQLARLKAEGSWPQLFRLLSKMPFSGLSVRTAAPLVWIAAIQPRISSAFEFQPRCLLRSAVGTPLTAIPPRDTNWWSVPAGGVEVTRTYDVTGLTVTSGVTRLSRNVVQMDHIRPNPLAPEFYI